MIKSVKCEGYRVFGSPTELELHPLTIVFGKNNSGKTTLVRLPLFIGASIHRPERYALAGQSVHFGSSFRDLATRTNPHPTVTYGAVLDGEDSMHVELQVQISGLEEQISVEEHSSAPERFEDVFSRVVHVGSARPPILPVYEARPATGATIEEAPYLLNWHPELMLAVSVWLQEHMQMRHITVERAGQGFSILAGLGLAAVNLANAGRGTQALIPIVTLIKAAELGLIDGDLFVIEEPEAHLHPSAHTAVAELLAEAAGSRQLVVETHSENLILRLRRKVALGEIGHDLVGLKWVDDENTIRPATITSDGGVEDWPAGVFEYDVEEARDILRARLRGLT